MKTKLIGVAVALMLYDVVSPAYSDLLDVSFTYSGGSRIPLPVPPGASNLDAFGTNNAGQIVGRVLSGSPQGFLYSGGSYTFLAVPGFDTTSASGISNTGNIVGTAYNSFSSTGSQGFLYSGGGYTPLAVPGATTRPSRVHARHTPT